MLATLVESKVDWLSMSVNRPSGMAELLSWRDAQFAAMEDQGFNEKRYSAHGYSYRSRGALSVGVGASAVLLQCSGGEASGLWRSRAASATNISRVDLACTARPDNPSSEIARREYESASTRTRGRGRRTSYTLIRSENRGDTLYVGSRASDQLGRLYDKGRESGDEAYKDCWRWEVQYRREPAVSVVRALLQAERETETIAATVARWFSDRGVGASYHTVGEPLSTAPARAIPDDVRWLAWARRCVAPRARELAVRYGWRYVAETLVGHISTYEEWESLVRGVEFEVQAMEGE